MFNVSGDYNSYFSFLSTWTQIVGTFAGLGGVFLLYYLFIIDKSIVSTIRVLLSIDLKIEDDELNNICNNLEIAVDVESVNEIKKGFHDFDQKIQLLNVSNENLSNPQIFSVLKNIQNNFSKRKSIIKNYIGSFAWALAAIIVGCYSILYFTPNLITLFHILCIISWATGVWSIIQTFFIVRTAFK